MIGLDFRRDGAALSGAVLSPGGLKWLDPSAQEL